MDTKLCTSCREVLPLAAFLRRPDGRSRGATCRKCEHARVAAWRKTEKGKASSLKTSREYHASEHGKPKRKQYVQTGAMRESQRRYARTEKGKASTARSNASEAGKACKNRYAKTAKFTESNRRYQATEKGKASLARGVHKRRAAMAIVSTLTAAEWTEIKARWGNRCVYCGRGMLRLTMDHLIPISKGGHHVALNVVPACRSCNSSKNNKTLREWRPEIAGRFGQ